ncbi:hypothetical protein H0H87_011429 [Tephrocybe sp. NHM501043]|nr:hypothetical protein H0H87_011429 [Tephrocybe sp. NHM501043]
MPKQSNATHARITNLQKSRAAKQRSANASTESAGVVEQARPHKKQRTQPPTLDFSARGKVSDKPVEANTQFRPLKKAIADGQATKAPTKAPAPSQGDNTAASTGSSTPTSTNTPSSGPFCLYSTNLPFLQKALVPDANTGTKDYAALFAKIKEYQQKNDRTAQCFLSFPSGPSNGYGRFKSSCYGFIEPMGDEPYDVGIAGLRKTDALVLPDQVGDKKPGIQGTLVLATSDCGVTSVSGDFKMTTVPVWKGANGEDIYEGYVKFNVQYELYARKGHGRGTSMNFEFWAIRSMEDDALTEGDVAQFAGRVGVSAGVGDLDFGFGDDDNNNDYDDEFELERVHSFDMSSRRYKYWFNNFRHSGIPYDQFDFDLDDY